MIAPPKCTIEYIIADFGIWNNIIKGEERDKNVDSLTDKYAVPDTHKGTAGEANAEICSRVLVQIRR